MPNGFVLGFESVFGVGKGVQNRVCGGMEGVSLETEGLVDGDGFEGDGFLFGGFLALGLQLTVDRDVGILVETSIALHACFGLGAAFDDCKIMVEEAHAPSERLQRMVVLDGVRLFLGFFDQLAVGDTGFRPAGRKVVCVEFEETQTEARRADDYALFVVPAFFSCVHGAPQGFHFHRRTK